MTNATPAATVPQVLADLILLGQRLDLPDPIELHAYENGIIALCLKTCDGVEAWTVALSAEDTAGINSQPYRGDSTLYTSKGVIRRRGWSIQISAVTPVDRAAPLDADTVAVLGVIAEGPAPRVSDERVEYIIDTLNAARDLEYEHDTEIANGRVVVVSTLVGVDSNLDQALAWAKSQPDVAAACGPLLGEANIQLVDGTVIEWQPEQKAWAVTVSDDAGAVSA